MNWALFKRKRPVWIKITWAKEGVVKVKKRPKRFPIILEGQLI